MSLTWKQRKTRLSSLINAEGEDAEGLMLDQLMHGQSVIGKTDKTKQIDSLRFNDKDLNIVGTLEYGQFGVIDVVTCKLDGCLYVRKSTEKRFALRTRDQCSPQRERDILLRARETDSQWAPHLLCAFQTPTHLNLVMDYAEGGTLWDVLESSPYDGKLSEADLRWWVPQVVSAIHWCHSQGFAHRDVKPHNFVLTSSAHIRLIDFGSAAPLLPPSTDGSQSIPLDHCLVPCGTCDYISPEVLQAHEEALVAMEMGDETTVHKNSGYGRETDWWSMGAMLYEMAYGVAPFFSREIRHTYAKIMEHHRSLKFDASAPVSQQLQDFLRRLLTSAELRMGRCDVKELQEHPFFADISFDDLHLKAKPAELHLPQFTYAAAVAPAAPTTSDPPTEESQSQSRAFAFSALFQSSPMTAPSGSQMSIVQATPSHGSTRSILREQPIAPFIGFTWGPPKDAFNQTTTSSSPTHRANITTPRPLQHLFTPLTPFGQLPTNVQSTPVGPRYPFATPVRPNALTPFQTLPRASTVRRTVQRRAVSDREAMKQLVDCVGMSARKKVLESGRKPRILLSIPRSATSTLKELRFDRSVAVVGDGGISFRVEQGSQSQSHSGLESMLLGASMLTTSSRASATSGSATGLTQEVLIEDLSSDLDSDVPPSPSPTPRPGSAMSILSRRSQTPTGSYFLRSGHSTSRSGEDARRSVSPSIVEPERAPAPIRTVPAPYEDKSSIMTTATMSFRADSTFSYDYLEQMERRYKQLMGDIVIVEGRLDEVSCMIRDDLGVTGR